MNLNIVLPICLICSLCVGCKKESQSDTPVQVGVLAQNTLDLMAEVLQIRYEELEIKNKDDCNDEFQNQTCVNAQFILWTDQDFDSKDWQIYFGYFGSLKLTKQQDFNISLVNGDLHRLVPAETFQGFTAGKHLKIQFFSSNRPVIEATYLPNFYIVAEGLEPRLIQSTRYSIDPETGLELRPNIVSLDVSAEDKKDFPAVGSKELYKSNLHTLNDLGLAFADGIIPTPTKTIPDVSGKRLSLAKGIFLNLKGVSREPLAAALQRLTKFGVLEKNSGIELKVSIVEEPLGSAESYRLNVNEQGISISAQDSMGAFYALQSLAALMTVGKTDIPYIQIMDAPRYHFRGLHIDVARNFHSKQLVLGVLEQMAAYKLNKLHLHLGDDEGWRLEIKGLPELTDIGSKRCHDLNERTCLLPQLGSGPFGNTNVDGYYTIDDYIEILKMAGERHIQVIPSFDMPGHARAAIKSMEARYYNFMARGNKKKADEFLLSDLNDKTVYRSIQNYNDNTLNVCQESTYVFIDKIMDEMKKIHLEAGQPLTRYHIGADETAGAWKNSPVCQNFLKNNSNNIVKVEQLSAYFIQRVAQLLLDKNIEVAGWSDGLSHTDPSKMPAIVQSNSWGVLSLAGHVEAHKHVNLGWQVVLSTPDALYFDFPYEAHPLEHGQYWAVPSVNTRKVFQFMPDNLPVHAEFWGDEFGRSFNSQDALDKNDQGEVKHQPIKINYGYIGMQGQLWSELLRSDELVEHMLFPRVLAMAERAWHKAEWEVPYNHKGLNYLPDTKYFSDTMKIRRDNDWNRFAHILAYKELAKLELAGIDYHIPMVGAVIEHDMLKANLILPGLSIEYREIDGEWLQYDGAVNVDSGKSIQLRAIAINGKLRGRSIDLN